MMQYLQEDHQRKDKICVAGEEEENITQIQKSDLYRMTDETQKNYKVNKKNWKINDKNNKWKLLMFEDMSVYSLWTKWWRNNKREENHLEIPKMQM